MAEPSDSEKVTLGPGLEVLIRPIRPGDRKLMSDGLRRLSPEAVYQRFFSPVEAFSDSDLTYLTEVDHSLHEALVAIDPEDGSLIAVARYVCDASEAADEGGQTEAEVAVTVADAWQGKGLATALLKRLTGRAVAEGVDFFVAIVLVENNAAAELFRHLVKGASTVSPGDPGTMEIRIELPGPEAFSDSVLARALSGSAGGSLKVAPWRRIQRRMSRG